MERVPSKTSEGAVESLSLKEKIARLRSQVEAQKQEVEKDKQQSKEEIVNEIADGIIGHQKLAEAHKARAHDKDVAWDKKELGYGYGEIQRNEWIKIDKERGDIAAKQQEFESVRAQVAELEAEAGSEAVAELKQELERGLADLERRKAALPQMEQARRSLEDRYHYYSQQQDDASKNIDSFVVENVIKAHKEFDGIDYSSEAGELMRLATEKVAGIKMAEWKKQEYEKEEKGMDEIEKKISDQVRKLTEAETVLRQLRAEFEKGYEAQERAIKNLPIGDISQLKREYEKKKDDDSFFTGKRSQKRAAEIEAMLKRMESDTFKDIPFDNRAMDDKILSELVGKFVGSDPYGKRDTHLEFIRFYDNEIPKGHPRSIEMQNAHREVVQRTAEVVKRIWQLRNDSQNRWNDIFPKLHKVFELG